MEIKVVIMNHNDEEFDSRLLEIRKANLLKESYDLEKDYIHLSEKRLDFIKKIIDKCTTNTLILFHTIEYGGKILNKLSNEIKDKKFYYIDGSVSGQKREIIKKEMEKNFEEVEYTILNFGDYEVSVKSDFDILLSNNEYKKAKDINIYDDIDDSFISSLRKNK